MEDLITLREEVKKLLGITDISKDDILDFIIKKVIARVIRYCNLKTIPLELETTIISMVIDGYRQIELGKEKPEGEAKSVTRGDTSVSYLTSVEIVQKWSNNPSLLNDYKAELNQYRKVRFFG